MQHVFIVFMIIIASVLTQFLSQIQSFGLGLLEQRISISGFLQFASQFFDFTKLWSLFQSLVDVDQRSILNGFSTDAITLEMLLVLAEFILLPFDIVDVRMGRLPLLSDH